MTPPRSRWKWADTPSTTVAGDSRITAREHHYHGEQNSTAFKLTIEEATILQTFPSSATKSARYADKIVVDLFAGSGVGAACQALGAREFGVENMEEALGTREAHGMSTIYEDVWDAHLLAPTMLESGIDLAVAPWTLWASPPCQAFSSAGSGAGRRALNDVLAVIHDRAYLDMTELRKRADELGDERIGLVLTPLHYAARFAPTWIALEQVPPVLPVWEAMAEHLREMGYSVWTGYLHAEQFGVPQTRKRAILMARRDGFDAAPPVPTHSRYYPRDKTRLDPGIKKWVSMEEALGEAGLWPTSRPAPTVTGGVRRPGERSRSEWRPATRSGGLSRRSQGD